MRFRIAALAAVTLGLAACGAEPATDDGAALLSALTDREASHYDLVVSSSDPGDAHAECAAYAEEMAERMAGMWELCRSRMGGGDYSRWSDTAGTIGDAVEAHRARCLADDDLAALREECAAHHREMGGLLDRLGGTMRSAGMMRDRGSCR